MNTITPAQTEYITKLIESANKAVSDEVAVRQGIHATAAALAMNNERNWIRIKTAQAEAAGEDVEAAKAVARTEAAERDEWEDEVNDDYWLTFYKERARTAMENHIEEVKAFTEVDVQSLTKEEASKAIDFLKNAHPHRVSLESRIIDDVIIEMTAETETVEEIQAPEAKATHILVDGERPAEIAKQASKTGWSKNWIVIANGTAIIANSNVDAVNYAAQLNRKEPQKFNGAASTGMRRRMRQTIAESFGVEWQDVAAFQRQVENGQDSWK
jgi:hypothetical protein